MTRPNQFDQAPEQMGQFGEGRPYLPGRRSRRRVENQPLTNDPFWSPNKQPLAMRAQTGHSPRLRVASSWNPQKKIIRFFHGPFE